jgi:hypothetical protein
MSIRGVRTMKNLFFKKFMVTTKVSGRRSLEKQAGSLVDKLYASFRYAVMKSLAFKFFTYLFVLSQLKSISDGDRFYVMHSNESKHRVVSNQYPRNPNLLLSNVSVSINAALPPIEKRVWRRMHPF